MQSERFKELLDELDGNSLQTLKEKNARYAQNGDCLHNFRSGAEIVGGTPAEACWGYLTKHLVALRDKVKKNDFSNREDFLEKCQDTINYIRFLWCIGNDDPNTENLHEMVDKIQPWCPMSMTPPLSNDLSNRMLCDLYHNEDSHYLICKGYENCDYYKTVVLKESNPND